MNKLFSLNIIVLAAISAAFNSFLEFFHIYVFSDWQFITFMTILIVIDSCLGFWRALNEKKVSSKGFGMIFKKMLMYMILLILSHVLVNFKIEGKQTSIFMWFDDLVYSAILLREAISILENIAIIYPNAVSKKILEKLKDYELSNKSDNHES